MLRSFSSYGSDNYCRPKFKWKLKENIRSKNTFEICFADGNFDDAGIINLLRIWNNSDDASIITLEMRSPLCGNIDLEKYQALIESCKLWNLHIDISKHYIDDEENSVDKSKYSYKIFFRTKDQQQVAKLVSYIDDIFNLGDVHLKLIFALIYNEPDKTEDKSKEKQGLLSSSTETNKENVTSKSPEEKTVCNATSSTNTVTSSLASEAISKLDKKCHVSSIENKILKWIKNGNFNEDGEVIYYLNERKLYNYEDEMKIIFHKDIVEKNNVIIAFTGNISLIYDLHKKCEKNSNIQKLEVYYDVFTKWQLDTTDKHLKCHIEKKLIHYFLDIIDTCGIGKIANSMKMDIEKEFPECSKILVKDKVSVQTSTIFKLAEPKKSDLNKPQLDNNDLLLRSKAIEYAKVKWCFSSVDSEKFANAIVNNIYDKSKMVTTIKKNLAWLFRPEEFVEEFCNSIQINSTILNHLKSSR